MANIEFWIQLENHRWDICPSGKDRMTGLNVEQLQGGKPPVNVGLHSPVTGHNRSNVKMFQPVRDSDGDVADALILRRYTANWADSDFLQPEAGWQAIRHSCRLGEWPTRAH